MIEDHLSTGTVSSSGVMLQIHYIQLTVTTIRNKVNNSFSVHTASYSPKGFCFLFEIVTWISSQNIKYQFKTVTNSHVGHSNVPLWQIELGWLGNHRKLDLKLGHFRHGPTLVGQKKKKNNRFDDYISSNFRMLMLQHEHELLVVYIMSYCISRWMFETSYVSCDHLLWRQTAAAHCPGRW